MCGPIVGLATTLSAVAETSGLRFSYGLVTSKARSPIFAAVSWKLWSAIGLGSAFLLFYLGGNYSFRYTHACARSHKKVIAIATHTGANFHTITVCDA